MRQVPCDELLNMAMNIGYQLLINGAEIYRVEESIQRILAAYDMRDCDIFAVPSCIFVTVNTPEGHPSHLSRPMLLVLAVALHNIPEGLALGVVIAAAMGQEAMTWTGALMFGLGLALQNFPEGLAVVLPLRQAGADKGKCHRLGLLASFAEPGAALVGLLFASLLSSLGGVIMPLLLSAAAGAMIFIVVEELIPESQAVHAEHGHAATYGFLLGFWMMALMGVLGG